MALRLDWNDDAKASAFYAGLSDYIKDHWVKDPPDILDDMVKEAIEFDNRYFERRMEKKGYFSSLGSYGANNRY